MKLFSTLEFRGSEIRTSQKTNKDYKICRFEDPAGALLEVLAPLELPVLTRGKSYVCVFEYNPRYKDLKLASCQDKAAK